MYFAKRRADPMAHGIRNFGSVRVKREPSMDFAIQINETKVEEKVTVTSRDVEMSIKVCKVQSIKSSEPAKAKRIRTKTFSECPICHKILRDVRQHIEAVHEKISRYTCTHCPKSFYRSAHLIAHIAGRHTFVKDSTSNSNRPFECEDCKKYFKTKADLKVHKKHHTSKFSLPKWWVFF